VTGFPALVLRLGCLLVLFGTSLPPEAPPVPTGAVAGPRPQMTPERTVTGTVLTSTRDPAIELRVQSPAVYVGADRWILYGVADCEIHVFVEADEAKRVSRLYWVQFEAYLPSVNASYNYQSSTRVSLGGREFLVDGGLFRTNAPYRRPDSDRERVVRLLASRGYSLPIEMLSRRLVHLPDADRRKELMIIYAEDLAPLGFSASDLGTGGKAAGELPRLQRDALARFQARVTVTSPAGRRVPGEDPHRP
jgi:hypothetical protein